MIYIPKRLRRLPFLGVLLALIQPLAAAQTSSETATGEGIYRFYCYQCHAYSGNGQTQAKAFLDPPPRDFTAPVSQALAATRMIDAVANGRRGTAMPSFSSVLTRGEIELVVAYVRTAFMGAARSQHSYHTEVNGWPDHARYKDAYDFVTGAISIETPAQSLTDAQLLGRSLYLSACISCHEQSFNGNDDVVWELRAVSYPRKHFSHRNGGTGERPIDIVSGASPYALHERPAIPATTSPEVMRGMRLYQANCAFCHAPDGTGRNWIGSLLEPKPRDFTARGFAFAETRDKFRELIRNGVPNTSMPAWRHVLSDEDINAIIAYIDIVFRP